MKAKLRPAVRAAIEHKITCDTPPPLDELGAKYCVVVCPDDGGVPVLFAFRLKTDLATFLSGQDGKDAFCWPFYGVPIPYSCAPNRVMICPDDTAVQITPVVALVRPEISLDSLAMQTDGYMGPAGFQEVEIRPTQSGTRKVQNKRDVAGSDDETASPVV